MPTLTATTTAVRGRPGRRWALRLAVALNAVMLLLVATEVAFLAATEDWLAAQVRSATRAGEVTARIDSFPFALGMVTTGTVGRVRVTATDVPAAALTLASVNVDARRLQLDRRALLARGEVRVTAVEWAGITVRITTQELSAAIGRQVSLSGQGTLVVAVNGVAVPLSVAIADGHILTLDAAGRRLAALDLTISPVVPSCDMTLDSTSGLVAVGCRVQPVPQSLVDALSNSLQG